MPEPAIPTDLERQWVRVGVDEIAHEGWVRVTRRTYRLPGGRLAEWELTGAADSVGVLALTPDERVVCVRQFRPGPDRVVLSLPGGIVDPGESPVDAAGRELTEETGYVSHDLRLVATLQSTSTLGRRHVVIGRDCRQEGRQALDEYEDCEPVVLGVSELRGQLTSGTMTAIDLAYVGLDHAGLL